MAFSPRRRRSAKAGHPGLYELNTGRQIIGLGKSPDNPDPHAIILHKRIADA